MTPDIHRAALRAAAKLALSAAVPAVLFACGGAADDSSNDDGNTASTATAREDLKASAAPKAVKTFCAEHYSCETTANCCKAEVADATFPKDATFSEKPDLRVDALTRDCCTILANAATGFEFPERTQCCSAIGWDGAASCTPWGPAVPPRMKMKISAPLLAA